ncbi:MAG: hypothetical protein E7773_06290 [Sphingomonas sp.]|uniref:hypothetical protein n=1 Tax=Sphingomonas sp. TaxID=28214 RepID=UPI0012075BE2|nr:hypothetical protein [Sphingomonas sp.]THD36615.1 MAG: hypothetical protein E7773_06290 [Sphingomonas sp.]
MTTPSGEERSIIAAKAAASASLRDTAKWLVGGVAATAAGIFAGSSLTHLGSLDLHQNAERLLMAIGGGVAGFVGLALILSRAIAVLTVESVGLPALAAGETATLAQVRDKMATIYAGTFPGNVTSVEQLLAKANDARLKHTDADKLFLAEFKLFFPKLMAEAGFQHVTQKFRSLIRALWIGGPLAIVGFGLFAWAANPPEDQAPAKPPVTIINNR